MTNHDRKIIKLQDVMRLFAKASKTSVAAQLLGDNYTRHNSIYKVGDFVELRDDRCGEIEHIRFDEHSNLSGMARLTIRLRNKRTMRKTTMFRVINKAEDIKTK